MLSDKDISILTEIIAAGVKVERVVIFGTETQWRERGSLSYIRRLAGHFEKSGYPVERIDQRGYVEDGVAKPEMALRRLFSLRTTGQLKKSFEHYGQNVLFVGGPHLRSRCLRALEEFRHVVVCDGILTAEQLKKLHGGQRSLLTVPPTRHYLCCLETVCAQLRSTEIEGIAAKVHLMRDCPSGEFRRMDFETALALVPEELRQQAPHGYVMYPGRWRSTEIMAGLAEGYGAYVHLCKQGERVLPLVFVGETGRREREDLEARLPGRAHILELPELAAETLAAVYNLAKVVVFPNATATTGLQEKEVLACGARVIMPAAAPMTELGGSEAVYIRPMPKDAKAYGKWVNRLGSTLHEVIHRTGE